MMKKGRVAALVLLAIPVLWVCQSIAGDLPKAAALEPLPLTSRTFKEFGQVVEASDTLKPTSENAVHKFWSGLAKERIHEKIDFGLLMVKDREHQVAEMQRHVKSAKLIVSLKEDYLLVVAPPTPSNARRAFPDPGKVKVFMVARDQAVILKKGTWHAMPFPANKEGLFLVAFRDGTARGDSSEKPFRKGEVIRF